MPRFNHAFTIAFEVHTDNDAESVTALELRQALEARLHSLTATADYDEIVEACGLPYDTAED